MFYFAVALSVSPMAYAGPIVPPDPIENMESKTEAESARAAMLIDRLEEIKAMDKSEMSRSEKKELRKEVKAIKSELKSTGNGVYLSVGAIIIIILLLILLL